MLVAKGKKLIGRKYACANERILRRARKSAFLGIIHFAHCSISSLSFFLFVDQRLFIHFKYCTFVQKEDIDSVPWLPANFRTLAAF